MEELTQESITRSICQDLMNHGQHFVLRIPKNSALVALYNNMRVPTYPLIRLVQLSCQGYFCLGKDEIDAACAEDPQGRRAAAVCASQKIRRMCQTLDSWTLRGMARVSRQDEEGAGSGYPVESAVPAGVGNPGVDRTAIAQQNMQARTKRRAKGASPESCPKRARRTPNPRKDEQSALQKRLQAPSGAPRSKPRAPNPRLAALQSRVNAARRGRNQTASKQGRGAAKRGDCIKNIEELLGRWIGAHDIVTRFVSADNLRGNIEAVLKHWQDNGAVLSVRKQILKHGMEIRLRQLDTAQPCTNIKKHLEEFGRALCVQNPGDQGVGARERMHWVYAFQKTEFKAPVFNQKACTTADRVYASLPASAVGVLSLPLSLEKPDVTVDRLVEAFEQTVNLAEVASVDAQKSIPKKPYEPCERVFVNLVKRLHCEWCEGVWQERQLAAFMRLKTNPITSAFAQPSVLCQYYRNPANLCKMAKYFLSDHCKLHTQYRDAIVVWNLDRSVLDQ